MIPVGSLRRDMCSISLGTHGHECNSHQLRFSENVPGMPHQPLAVRRPWLGETLPRIGFNMPIERHLPRIYRLLVGIYRVFILDYTRDPAGDRIKPAVETDSLGGWAPHTMPATWGPCCTTPVIICDTWRTFTSYTCARCRRSLSEHG